MVRSPEQQYALAKSLPISELAKVLQGQSDVVDMWVAESTLRQKTEAQKAKQGMMAQQMAQSPKIVEKDLMEAQQVMQPRVQPQIQPNMEQGIAALPVGGIGEIGNMNGAGGGIVAFDDGGPVEHYQNQGYVQSSVGAPLQSTRVPGQGPTFGSVFGNAAKATSRMPGFLGRLGALSLGPMMAFEAMTGPSEEDVAKLREFDRAKAVLKEAGFSDKDIAALKSPDVYRMASGYGYKPATPQAAAPAAEAAAPTVPEVAPVIPPVSAEEKGIASLVAPRLPTPKEITPAEAGRERLDYYKALGIEADPFSKAREAIEKDRAGDAAARRQADWFRVFEASMGILGGESPYAAVNIGKGTQSAIKGAIEDREKFNKLERDRKKEEGRLAFDQNAYLKSGADSDLAKVDKRREKIADIGLEQAKLNAAFDLKRIELAASKGDKRMASALEAAQRDWKNLPEAQRLTGKFDEESFIRDRAIKYLGFLQSGSFGSAPASQPRGKVVNGVYVPAGQ